LHCPDPALPTDLRSWYAPRSVAGLIMGLCLALVGVPTTAAEPTVLDLLSATLEDCAAKAGRGDGAGGAANDTAAARTATPKDPSDYYPTASMMQGDQAIVLLELLIDEYGNPRFAHVARSLPTSPKSLFAEQAIRMVHDSRWAAARRAGHAVASWKKIKFNFTIPTDGKLGNIIDEHKLAKFMKDAANGDQNSIGVVSYVNSIAGTEVVLSAEQQSRYLAYSAMAGERSAALRVAQLLSNPLCTRPPIVEELLRRQATRGFSAGEMILAAQLMRGNDPTANAEIATLLHGAANSIDSFIQLWATGLLATAPVVEWRDPVFALANATTFAARSRDPDTLEALAAAQAANGRYPEAVASQQRALEAAGALHWNDAPMRARLQVYQSGQSWTGYLCDCTQLVPGEGI
jgi:hypothetical protein